MEWVVLRRYKVPRAQISFPGAFDYTWRAQMVLVVLILSFWSNFNPNQLYMCMFVCICIHYECNPWSLERNLNYQWLYKLLPRISHLLLYFPHNQVSRSVARRKFDGFASYVALERSGGEYHVTTQFYFYPVMSKLQNSINIYPWFWRHKISETRIVLNMTSSWCAIVTSRLWCLTQWSVPNDS